MRANSITGSYNNDGVHRGPAAVGAVKPAAIAQREILNITNSMIISNSQILFQDSGNGKIIPMPFTQNLGAA
jgi:hypothetical protein